jgi:hypothetical protein
MVAFRCVLVLMLALVQWWALGKLFRPYGVFVDEVTAVPLALMALFHLSSLVLCAAPRSPRGHLVWRCLFAGNLGYAIVLVPILMRPSPCTRLSFTVAATIALEVYGPILVTRVFLRKPGNFGADAPR